MLTTMDKGWVSGLMAFLGHYLTTKFGWDFVTPELVGLATGVATYWIPNRPEAPKA